MKSICIALLLISLTISASEQTVFGTVSDIKGIPLQGANIYIDGTLDGAVSDANGRFSFKTTAKDSQLLVCSYLGYAISKIALHLQSNSSTQLAVQLISQELRGETVTVTASNFSSGSEKGVTLTPLEVLTIPGAAADIFRAIQSFPGLQQVDDGAGLFVRGGDVSETAIIIDGAYLKRPYRYESPTGGFFGTISPFLVKGTSFSSGGFGAQHGNALSGVLSMQSRDIPLQRKITVGAGLAAFSLLAELPVSEEKFGVSLSGNFSDTEALFKLNNHQRKISSYPRSYDLNVNSVYKYTATGQVKLFLFQEGNRTGIEIPEPGQTAFFEGNGTTQLGNIQLKQALGTSLVVKVNIAQSNFVREQNLRFLDLNIEEQFGQLSSSAEYLFASGNSLLSGISFFRNTIRYDGIVPIEDPSPGAPTSYRISTNHRNNQPTVFQKLKASAGKLNYAIGWRAEHHSIANTTTIDPRASLSYRMSKDFTLVFSGGQYHQLPDLDYFDAEIGSATLQPQKAWHSVGGVSFENEAWHFRAEAYYKRYRQLVQESGAQLTSNGNGYSRGVDLFLKRNHARYSGWISYSYLQSRREWLDAPTLSPTRFDITNQLTIVGKAALSLRWNVAFSYRFATGRPFTSSATTYHDSRVAAYHKGDLSINYLRSFFPGNLTVFYAAVANVFNRNNIFDYSYSPDYSQRVAVTSTMRRNVYFGMSFSL
ncbi:MAG: TonB-dependent receptor [Calditrichia bacterium]